MTGRKSKIAFNFHFKHPCTLRYRYLRDYQILGMCNLIKLKGADLGCFSRAKRRGRDAFWPGLLLDGPEWAY